MKKRYWLFILINMTIAISGCATHRQMAEADLELQYIRQEHSQIKATLAHLDSLLTEQNDTQKRLNAELKMSMGTLDERMLLLEQRLGDVIGMFNKPSAKIETMNTIPTETDLADTTEAPGQVDQLKLYQYAYADLTKGNYDMAIKGFDELLKSYPNSALADNAVFWIGECHYFQKSYANAQKWYEKIIKDYPKSEHVAAAKYKLGMSLYNQQYKTKAKQYFQDVAKDYPGTEEANKASEMLSRY